MISPLKALGSNPLETRIGWKLVGYFVGISKNQIKKTQCQSQDLRFN